MRQKKTSKIREYRLGRSIVQMVPFQRISIKKKTQQQKESLQALLDYCFQHAERPNPLQDLIDKGLLSETYTGETCKSVKQMYDLLEFEISEYNKNKSAGYENRTAEFEEKARRQFEYMECAQNQTTTNEECARILNGTK